MDNNALAAGIGQLSESLEDFEKLCNYIETHSFEEIVTISAQGLGISIDELINHPMGGYRRTLAADGSLSRENGCYYFVLQDLKTHLEEYRALYYRLCEERSRKIFTDLFCFRVFPDREFIYAAYTASAKYPQYFDEDIYRFADDEVFIDCGGFTGDTTEEFIKHCGNYKHIYIYEPMDDNYRRCIKTFDGQRDITVRKAGVGSVAANAAFGSGGDSSSSFAALGQASSERDSDGIAQIVTLDEDIREPVSLIKMDVECFEPEAIRGAAGHIRNDSPKLAICLYHMVSDIWEIPKLITEINPAYNYYIRHYSQDQNFETVLYAIPDDACRQERTYAIRLNEKHPNDEHPNEMGPNVQTVDNSNSNAALISQLLSATAPLIGQVDGLPVDTAVELYGMYEDAAKTATVNRGAINMQLRVRLCDGMDRLMERIADDMPPLSGFDVSKHKNIYTPGVTLSSVWGNVHVMKGTGLTGYTLGKELSMHPVMFFGDANSDYPSLSAVPGMEMLRIDASSDDLFGTYIEHLKENYAQMDLLVLYGMYQQYLEYLDIYRQLRPDGKVYCALDMNLWYMGKVDWGSEPVVRFSSQCDVIATSCRTVRDALNSNPAVAFPCRWFTNGFYNPAGVAVKADASLKEKVILTVGRIGSEQKNNGEMMTAFAVVAERLPGWTMRLVGPVEPSFQPFIDSFFKRLPHMKDRIVFTGAINGKVELYKEYAAASIFALSSFFEGFPNVYADALHHGCMFVTSDIDAADDMTNFGELGTVYKSGDIDGLASELAKMCAAVDGGALEQHIPKALRYASRYFDWGRNAKKLGYMLFGS